MSAMLDPVIHQATRLRIMAALQRNREATFTGLRDGLQLTDGNLASHAAKLEEAGYLTSRHALANVSFELRYRITPEGDAAFGRYLDGLADVLGATLSAPFVARPGGGSASVKGMPP